MNFQRNIAALVQSNPRLNEDKDEFAEVMSKAQEKIEAYSDVIESIDEWLNGPTKSIHFPAFLNRATNVIEAWRQEQLEQFGNSSIDINSYIGIHREVHLYDAMISIYDCLMDLGIDPSESTSAVAPKAERMILCGTGNGTLVKELIYRLKPRQLRIFVTDWSDFMSSFNNIDWSEIWNAYMQAPDHEITIAKVSNEYELLQLAVSDSLLGTEHSYFYLSPQAETNLKEFSSILFSEHVCNLIYYLGYTVDEYNMLFNTVITLKNEPRQFKIPTENVGGQCIVCGSGPSLDLDIESLKLLQYNHTIIAGGSNIRTLLKNNIRVDFLTLVERDASVFDVYYQLSLEYNLKNTILLMSTTCNERLLSLFKDTIVFYRPALTPVALFCEHPTEVLNYEGPEAVNAAVALASSLGFNTITFVGVDLGSIDLDKDRSDGAADYSIRTWDRSEIGNFQDKVHTNKPMIDVKIAIEMAIISNPHINYNNCSNGMLIKGATSIKLIDYLQEAQHILSDESFSQIKSWLNSLYRHREEHINAKWDSLNVRFACSSIINELIEVLEKPIIVWERDYFNAAEKILDISKEQGRQLASRIIRSTVNKTALTITQQMYILKHNQPELIEVFMLRGKKILIDMLNRLREEIFDLCDTIEAYASAEEQK